MASGPPEGDDVRLGSDTRALSRDGLTRARQISGERGRCGDIARRGVWPGRGWPCAVRAHRERATHQPSGAKPAERADQAGLSVSQLDDVDDPPGQRTRTAWNLAEIVAVGLLVILFLLLVTSLIGSVTTPYLF